MPSFTSVCKEKAAEEITAYIVLECINELYIEEMVAYSF